jgi:tRNA-Thr(GGU) m(6)t(6)A37 methyltransferase TsaA
LAICAKSFLGSGNYLARMQGLHDWGGARRPDRAAIEGERVRLEPLTAAHAPAVLEAAQGAEADPKLWHFLPYGPFADARELADWIRSNTAADDPLFFAIVETASGTPAGVASYLRIHPEHGSIEIGHIWFGGRLQRTPAATEAIFLLARQAFDVLGYRRLEWKCDAQNERSRRAAGRFGFTFEGVFRQHQIVKGRNRDTAWYSLLDREWPAARRAYEAWLDPANFDADGRQREPLRAGANRGPVEITPIGFVESPLIDPASAPKQGDEGAPDAWVRFDAAVSAALEGIDRGDQIILLSWFHLARRDVLRVHPRGDRSRPEQGVFNTRSPDRPNPIGLHRVEVIAIDGAKLLVRGLEAVDGTPIIDVKPVLSRDQSER